MASQLSFFPFPPLKDAAQGEQTLLLWEVVMVARLRSASTRPKMLLANWVGA